MRAQRASENARLPQASLGRRHADVASKRPVAQRNDNGARASRAYARRSAAPAARGVYQPRRPQASPLFRLVSDHRHRLQTVYVDRFAREYGPWRPVVAQVADKLLTCGVLDHGFSRIRCDACTHECLLAFSCQCRCFCPSCHAKRLAIWTQWLDTTLLAPVPHRQVVRTIPKRLRAYCLYRRRLLGEIARVATRTVTAAIRTLTGERDLAVSIVACLQTHGSRANWHPHLHLLVTDGGFRLDGTFVSWPAHDTARLTEAFRRAVLRPFVRLELFDEEQAAVQKIAAAESVADAERERQRFHRDDRLRFPKACERLDRDWSRMLTYAQFPKEYWRLLQVAEKRFRKVNAPEQCRDVFRGVRYADGIDVPVLSSTQKAAA